MIWPWSGSSLKTILCCFLPETFVSGVPACSNAGTTGSTGGLDGVIDGLGTSPGKSGDADVFAVIGGGNGIW